MTAPGIFIVASSTQRRSTIQKSLCASMPGASVHAGPQLSPDLMQRYGAEVLVADLESSEEADTMLTFLSNLPTGIAVVALIDDPDPLWVRRALAVGVNAITSREATQEDLRLAIGAADAGLVLLHPTSARLLISPVLPFEPENNYPYVEHLTAREREVLGLIAAGMGNKDIAFRLGISEHTVKFHASSILGKLGASSRTEAVSRGIRRGLISL